MITMLTIIGIIAAIGSEWGIVLICLLLASCVS